MKEIEKAIDGVEELAEYVAEILGVEVTQSLLAPVMNLLKGELDKATEAAKWESEEQRVETLAKEREERIKQLQEEANAALSPKVVEAEAEKPKNKAK